MSARHRRNTCMYVESNRGTVNRGNPRADPRYIMNRCRPARHFRPSRGETGPRLRVARLRTWPPVVGIPTKLYFLGTHQLRNIVEITPARSQSRVCSPDVVPVEIFDRAFPPFDRSNVTAPDVRRNRRFHCLEQQTYAHASFSVYRSPNASRRSRNGFKIVDREYRGGSPKYFTFILMKGLNAIKRNWYTICAGIARTNDHRVYVRHAPPIITSAQDIIIVALTLINYRALINFSTVCGKQF